MENKIDNTNVEKIDKKLIISDVMVMLPFDEKMEELIINRSKLYTSYSVKDNEGKYRNVVDIDSVVELLRELLSN